MRLAVSTAPTEAIGYTAPFFKNQTHATLNKQENVKNYRVKIFSHHKQMVI